MNKKFLWIGLLGLASFLIVHMMRPSEPSNQMRAKSPRSIKTEKIELIAKPKAVKRSKADLRNKRRAFRKNLEAGLVATPTKPIRGKYQLDFEFKALTRHCELGDLDFIRMDQSMRTTGKGITMTVEAMGGERVLDSQSLDINTLLSGKASFSVSVPQETTTVGVYLCSGRRKSCSDLDPIDLNTLFKRRLKNKRHGNSILYFHQSLVLTPQQVFIDQGGRSKKNLFSALKNQGADLSSAKDATKAIIKSESRLSSESIRFEQGSYVISLPRNSDSCPIPM
ncbi:hypothetical protein [Pseudobacteriovorax antillogorgiicola]|uniref:Uncharacterized protein n=1 Tax=Pseudobacteriovorax antillogorgiicola TaxID=1513793 RepID=A0A1Y6BZ32_9BACT|nr:hypothetical protein [Pseudobacteriovorax antillogorgiicola]TCS53133.1 hypothetical protein EDD56_108184 [Pseudobacteriovorax antillogorgiicola]SMF25338.1 hypothetical protein SAMN06296036_10862 [Pseudobacteriovorax antillogorgiicola]